MAIDGSGNVWVNGGHQVISNSGAQLSQILGGWNSPGDVAVDSGGNAWIVDSGNNNLHKITNGGTQTIYTGGGLSPPMGVAIDGGGNVWVANRNGNSVSEFSNSGTAISPTAGYAANHFLSPAGIAIDGSGNVWVTNLSNGSATEVVGTEVPVITPIAAGLPGDTDAEWDEQFGDATMTAGRAGVLQVVLLNRLVFNYRRRCRISTGDNRPMQLIDVPTWLRITIRPRKRRCIQEHSCGQGWGKTHAGDGLRGATGGEKQNGFVGPV